jgi:hypothetical protein
VAVSFSRCHMMNRGVALSGLTASEIRAAGAAGKETMWALRIFCLHLKLLNITDMKKLPVT